MKKRIIAMALALVLCLSLGSAAFADYHEYDSIITVYDENGNENIYPLETDASGKGWSWDASALTLTLNNFKTERGIYFDNAGKTLYIKLADGSVNYVGRLCCWTVDSLPANYPTVYLSGKGTLNTTEISTGVLDLTDASIVMDSKYASMSATLRMHSGSIKGCYIQGRIDFQDAYYGGTLDLSSSWDAALGVFEGDSPSYNSAFASVPATDADGNPLTWGHYEQYGSWYAGYLNAAGEPSGTVCIGVGAKPETPTAPSFSDVKESDWWTPYIAPAASAGLVAGNADGTYNPKGELTWAQTLVFATRLDQYNKGEHIYGAEDQTGKWYQIYLDYCLAQGIIDAAPANIGAPIDRANAAIIFAAVLGDAKDVNSVPADYFSDVASDSDCYEAVMALAKAGIVNGMGDGSFGVDGAFTRAQVAAMVSRIAGLIDPVEI